MHFASDITGTLANCNAVSVEIMSVVPIFSVVVDLSVTSSVVVPKDVDTAVSLKKLLMIKKKDCSLVAIISNGKISQLFDHVHF